MRRFDTVLFDLDGTLLDTLEDICGAANHTLRELGYPERTLAEMRRFVGNGAEMQMRRALGAELHSSHDGRRRADVLRISAHASLADNAGRNAVLLQGRRE